MGDVLKVQDARGNPAVALKYCRENVSRQRFAREVRIMKSISSPSVIPILDVNLEHEPPYFVMPLGAESLEDAKASFKGNETLVLDMFEQICKGVIDIHDRNVVHRDLKPANILRLLDGSVVISDLGLATFEDRDTTVLTTGIQQLGTEDYLAPEQRQSGGGAQTERRTDVYQLGKMLYHLLTGLTPRWVDSTKLPGGLDHIVRRATAENPEGRYQDVKSLLSSLTTYRVSMDARANPREALENIITALEDAFPNAIPSHERLSGLMEVLSYTSLLDHALVLESFHRVPVKWLPDIARACDSVLNPVLLAYATAIQERVGGYQFPFADDVCERMKAIYEHSAAVSTRVLALRALMTSADKLGRYAPQSTFCNYLMKVTTIELALPIAEMISEYATDSLKEFRGYNIKQYHPAIKKTVEGLGSRFDAFDIGEHRVADLRSVKRIYANLPGPLVKFFLKEAMEDRVHLEILTVIDPSAEIVNSLSFSLYDRTLFTLFRRFFGDWALAASMSEELFHDYEQQGVATLHRNFSSSGEILERREQFRNHVGSAEKALIELNSHVEQTFPQFDVQESDKSGVASFEKWKGRVDRADVPHICP